MHSRTFDVDTSSLTEVLAAALKYGPQIITKAGVEVAVLVPIDLWNRLKASRDIPSDPLDSR